MGARSPTTGGNHHFGLLSHLNFFIFFYNFCHQFGILLGFMVMLVIELISSDTTENDEDMELVNGTKTKIVDLEEGSWTGLVENPDMQVGFRMFSTK